MRVLMRLVGLVLMLVDSTLTHSAFSCEPVLVNWCRNMPYNSTFFPNLLGHYDQDIAAEEMKHFTPLIRLSCSPDVHLFLCRTFFPECGENQSILKPCKQACERVLRNCSEEIRTFGITWPPQLQCEKLLSCDSDAVAPNETSLHNPAATRNLGFWCPLPLKTRPGKGSTFLGAPDCAPPCAHMFLTVREVRLAKTFIGVCSVMCLCATLFTVLTFLIDVKRFRYPERPIVFYAVCYSFVSLAYLLGFLLGDSVACAEPALPGGESTVVLGSQNRGCSLLFMMLYFFSSAGMAWWVVLTFTWFLAAGPKWSCEAIEQKAVWFHGVAWGLPGVLTVLLLALSKPEGDGLSGVCFVGLHDLTTLRWFVVAPALLAVTAGVSLLLAGIVCLSRVRQVIQHDQQNRRKLKKFMIRIGVFSALYLLPLLLLLGCRLHELSHRHSWENSWIARHCQHYSIPCSHQDSGVDRPALSLFLLKYLVTLVVGIPAVFWVSSKKTCTEWSAFLNRTRKKDPISESRRVLQESCNFFLQHNSRKQHKQSSSSHQLKVLSKSMGTSTGQDATIRAATDRGSE